MADDRMAEALERIAAALEKIAERRDADDNLIGEDRCLKCGLPEWDCECFADTYSGPYACLQCGKGEGYQHVIGCTRIAEDGEIVKAPPVRDSLPKFSTQRGGVRFTDSGLVDIPWWKGIATPGAPPPERPDVMHFDPTPEPVFRKGDTIIVHTLGGERQEFVVGEDNPPRPVEGTPGTWSHCGNPKEHAAHVFDTGSNEGPYYNVQCLGTPRDEGIGKPRSTGGPVNDQGIPM